jgi:MFS family permease
VQPLLPAFTQEFGVSGAQSSLSLSTGGAMADRLDRKPVLVTGIVVAGVGVLATLLHALAGMALGVVMLTVGFFIAHSVASGWVGRMASQTKGHAASLYLLAYYAGSSVMGSMGGWAWAHPPAVDQNCACPSPVRSCTQRMACCSAWRSASASVP